MDEFMQKLFVVIGLALLFISLAWSIMSPFGFVWIPIFAGAIFCYAGLNS